MLKLMKVSFSAPVSIEKDGCVWRFHSGFGFGFDRCLTHVEGTKKMLELSGMTVLKEPIGEKWRGRRFSLYSALLELDSVHRGFMSRCFILGRCIDLRINYN